MGKRRKVKSTKQEVVYDNKDDEMYRPFLIHATTYVLLTDQLLSLMPSDRNVLLTMNEYDLCDINPMHLNTSDSPTHVIIFCIRFVSDDMFQPIGGLLIYKYKDQSLILAECLKAYINDLWKLGLYVVATVSPPFETFKRIISHLVDIKDFSTYSGIITYSVAPFKEIVHIYDLQYLLIKLQTLFREGDIKFTEGTREYQASWNDIAVVLDLSVEFKILSDYLSDNKQVSRRVHIFTQQLFEQFLELESEGVLSSKAGGTAVLLNCVRSFLQYIEIDLLNLKIMCESEAWENLTDILHNMTFQKSKTRTCTKEKPTQIHTLTRPSIRRRIEFEAELDSNMEQLAANIEENLIIIEQNSVKNNLLEKFEFNTTVNEDQYNGIELPKNEHYEEKEMNQENGTIILSNKQRKLKKKNCLSKEKVKEDICKIIDENLNFRKGPTVMKKHHLKKPYDKNNSKQATSEKCSLMKNKTAVSKEPILNLIDKSKEYSVDNKPLCKTDISLESMNSKNIEPNNFINLDVNCDKDKNNNSSEILLNNDVKKKKSTTTNDKCDNKVKQNKKNKNKLKEEDFEVVINDASKFFACFTNYDDLKDLGVIPMRTIEDNKMFTQDSLNIGKDNTNSLLFINEENILKEFSGLNVTDVSTNNNCLINDAQECVQNFDDFCSKSDEETENCITESCDKVPNIIELLSDDTNKENSDEFEQNNITFELLSTITGMKKLMQNLQKRRVRMVKPDAFVVEHIDFLVTVIKRDKNRISPVYYYGHNYCFLNAELAFVTLHNNNGLYLVSM